MEQRAGRAVAYRAANPGSERPLRDPVRVGLLDESVGGPDRKGMSDAPRKKAAFT
jgi:hypothetical protein